jgi:hypothetical protein
LSLEILGDRSLVFKHFALIDARPAFDSKALST